MDTQQKAKIKAIYAKGQKYYIRKNTTLGVIVYWLVIMTINFILNMFFHLPGKSKGYISAMMIIMPFVIRNAYKRNWDKIEIQYLKIVDEEENGPQAQSSIDRALSRYE